MQYLKAFIAGFVSTLVFHQGLLGLLHLAGITPFAPYSMTATGPLHVPQVISLSFWGGVWGIVLWLLIANARGAVYWSRAAIIGAIGPSVVAWFVVMPLKGMGMAGGWNPHIIAGALLLNAAWGLGVALIMRLLLRSPAN
ncbi:MAG: hypothetical protein ACRETW_11465 [Stenotrophobium sp.]